ncbi:MAG: hypothetical protein ACYDEN_04490 [Acidimicrobiales bacterium]
MADLLDALRLLRRSGAEVAVDAIDPAQVIQHSQTPEEPTAIRERAMAHRLAVALREHPGWASIVLAGNGHTRTTPAAEPFGYVSMGWYLLQRPPDVTSRRGVTSGGTAWNIAALGQSGAIQLVREDSLDPLGHQDVLPIGAVTASAPMIDSTP